MNGRIHFSIEIFYLDNKYKFGKTQELIILGLTFSNLFKNTDIHKDIVGNKTF